MEDPYVGRWFRYGMGLGKLIARHETYYKCIIFAGMVMLTWRSLEEVKSLRFLNCPEYYNLMLPEVEMWEAIALKTDPIRHDLAIDRQWNVEESK